MNRSTSPDAEILDLYFTRDERAIKESDRRYGVACMGLSMNILNSRPDAEECVNDTYLKAWNTIPPTRPQSLRGYLLRIVRHLSLNRLRDLTAAKRSRDLTVSFSELEDCLPVREEFSAELSMLLSDFLKKQEETDRRLFLGRYWYAVPVKRLATEHGVTVGLVYKRLERTREALRVYLSQRGYTV